MNVKTKRCSQKCRFVYIFLIVILFQAFGSSVYAAQNRIALVIGNSSYKDKSLKNPVNDATDVAAKLRALDFDVDEMLDATFRDMEKAISQFGKKLNQEGTVGLFYFAGHGVQIDNSNYMIPIGAKIIDEADVMFEAVDVGRVLGKMQLAENNLNLVILDACRDNPFASTFRSSSRGLAKMNAPKGTYVLYATSPGNTAADGTGRNGLFTEKLLESIDTPGLSVEEVFKKTAREVDKASESKQTPWVEGVILGDFYFNSEQPEAIGKKTNIPILETAPHIMAEHKENIYWNSVEALPSIGAYKDYIKKYPKGHYKSLALMKIDQLNSVSSRQKVFFFDLAQHDIDMLSIPGGKFKMGSPAYEKGRASDEKLHTVEIKSFSINRTEVTLRAFKKFVDDSGYLTDAHQNSQGKLGCYTEKNGSWGYHAGRNFENPGFAQLGSHPVVCISHNDAMAYIAWLNKKSQRKFRLPTEAEWEFAARAGDSNSRHWGNSPNKACEYSNVADLSVKQKYSSWVLHYCNDKFIYTAPVGSYLPNRYGLQDALGNVSEWTCSAWDGSYDGNEKKCHPKAKMYVFRGGSWDFVPDELRSANRDGDSPFERVGNVGFRLVQVD